MLFLSALLVLCLAPLLCTAQSTDAPAATRSGSGTTPALAPASIELKINKATDTIDKLNRDVIDSLAGTLDSDAHSSIGSYANSDALPTSENVTESAPSSASGNSTTAANDQKFSSVLKDLQGLEEQLKDSLRNLTAARHSALRGMLRPMLQQVQQLRTNLTHLRNHMIGYHAVTELQQHIHDLTAELGDVITAPLPTAPGQAAGSVPSRPGALAADKQL